MEYMNHHEYYSYKHSQKRNNQASGLNTITENKDGNADLNLQMSGKNKARTPLLQEYNEVRKLVKGYLSPDKTKGLKILTSSDSQSQLPPIKPSQSVSPFQTQKKYTYGTMKDTDDDSKSKYVKSSNDMFKAAGRQSIESTSIKTGAIPQTKFGSQAWQQQQRTIDNQKSSRRNQEDSARTNLNQNTKLAAKDLNFPEARSSLLQMDFPLPSQYKDQQKKTNDDINALLQGMTENQGSVKLTKSFLREIDVKESDLYIKKTVADKKREFETIQDKWTQDNFGQIENRQTQFMQDNHQKMERLRQVQINALKDDAKPKIKLLDRNEKDTEVVKKNIRETNNVNRAIHKEIQNMELLLKMNVEENKNMHKSGFVQGLRKFHDVYRKLQDDYQDATDKDKIMRQIEDKIKERDNIHQMCIYLENESQKKYDEYVKLRALIGDVQQNMDLDDDDDDNGANDNADKRKKYQGEMEVQLDFLESLREAAELNEFKLKNRIMEINDDIKELREGKASDRIGMGTDQSLMERSMRDAHLKTLTASTDAGQSQHNFNKRKGDILQGDDYFEYVQRNFDGFIQHLEKKNYMIKDTNDRKLNAQ